MFCGKMRFAHFSTKHPKSGKRRRREQVIKMEVRHILGTWVL